MSKYKFELKLIKRRTTLYQKNAKKLMRLTEKAVDNKNYAEFTLLHYSLLEMFLISLIETEMLLASFENISEGRKKHYSEDFINSICREWRMGQIINFFCLLFGDSVRKDLLKIKQQRVLLQHKFFKKPLIKGGFRKILKNYYNQVQKPTVRLSKFIKATTNNMHKRMNKVEKALGWRKTKHQ